MKPAVKQEISKVFNSNVLKSLALGDFTFSKKIAHDFFNYEKLNKNNLQTFIKEVFGFLTNTYQNEYYFKTKIIEEFLKKEHSYDNTTILSEFRVGRNKADSVIINGSSTCYEVKTDYDDLTKLNDQVASYLNIFEYVYVVTTEKHFENSIDVLPINVGLILLDNNNKLNTYRKAEYSCDVNIDILMSSLRKAEYLQLAQKFTNKPVEAPNTRIYSLCRDIINQALIDNDHSYIKQSFAKIVKESRENNMAVIKELPLYMQNALISYNFSDKHISSLREYFK